MFTGQKTFGSLNGPKKPFLFVRVNLFGAKQLSPCYATNTRKIADFVKAFIAADRFPNLHAVDIKYINVGGQA